MRRHSFIAGLLLFGVFSVGAAQPPPVPKMPVNPAQPNLQQITPQAVPPRVAPQPQIVPPPNTGIARHLQGQITRLDPLRNIIHVQSGFGNAARELALHVNAATRFFGPGGVVIADGLNNRFFAPGATIWYQAGSNGNAQMLTDVRTYDPNQSDVQAQATDRLVIVPPVLDIRGEIVRVDPHTRSVVLRTSEGEMQLIAADNARVWDANRVLIAEGLTYRGLRSNATVWVRTSAANPKSVAEIRLYDPSQTELDVRGQIVSVAPDDNVFVARTAQGEVEYRITSATRYWDVNRRPIADGMSYPLFRPGSTVWLRLGTVGSALVVTEMRFYDPATPEPRLESAAVDQRGQVIRVYPEERRIVLRVGENSFATEMEYHVAANARYWDANKQPFAEGLNYPGFRPGAVVWFRLGTVDNYQAITEFRFAHPEQPALIDTLPINDNLGYRTFPPGTISRYVPVRLNLSDIPADPTVIRAKP